MGSLKRSKTAKKTEAKYSVPYTIYHITQTDNVERPPPACTLDRMPRRRLGRHMPTPGRAGVKHNSLSTLFLSLSLIVGDVTRALLIR